MGAFNDPGSAAMTAQTQVARPGRIHKSIQVIAIGASTGGPGALVEVLRGLPSGLAVPVLIVIHIGEPFGTTFAEWLDAQTSHHVKIATDGQWLNRPGVFVAPGNLHLSVLDRRLHIGDGPERHSCRPSVDVLFESVASEYGPHAVACLLTGMGHDGASGLLAVHQAGGITIAQDEATCVVYGMPREAVLLGAAQRVLPIQEIGSALAALVATAEGASDG
jgi:two-component system chemotaxis response regulator CheB